MTEAYIPEEFFDRVSDIFKEFCGKWDIKVLATAVEKHGSWEWSGHRKDSEINRYIALALTDDIEDLQDIRVYVAELWAEADDGLHFARRLSSTFRVQEEMVAQDVFNERLSQSLAISWQQAKKLGQADFTAPYVTPRS